MVWDYIPYVSTFKFNKNLSDPTNITMEQIFCKIHNVHQHVWQVFCKSLLTHKCLECASILSLFIHHEFEDYPSMFNQHIQFVSNILYIIFIEHAIRQLTTKWLFSIVAPPQVIFQMPFRFNITWFFSFDVSLLLRVAQLWKIIIQTLLNNRMLLVGYLTKLIPTRRP